MKIIAVIEKILTVIVAILGIALVSTVTLQILGRYILYRPYFWTEELSRFIFVAIIALGAPLAVRTNQFIRLDAFYMLLPVEKRKILIPVLNLLVAIFLFVVAYNAISLIRVGYLQKSAVLRIPMAYPFSTTMIGPLLAGIFFIDDAINIRRDRKEV